MIVMIATNVTIAMNAPATIGTMVATTASRCVHLNIECWRTLTTSNCLNFFLQDRRKNHDEDDTPEWFHGGPTSQHDTIELRGFDEEKDRSKSGKSGKKETAKERQIANGKKVDEAPLVNGSSRPGSSSSGKITKEDQSTSENNLKYNDESVMEIVYAKSFYCQSRKQGAIREQEQSDFNIEDFLKLDGDGLGDIGLGSTGTEESTRASRSSRWFGKSNEKADSNSTSVAPADQAGSTSTTKQDAARSLLEMLQKGTQPQPVENVKKVVTAEELERSTGNLLA